jgi:D-alanyl-D-alanine endopeptidase (penicillin-binding protein 7)
MMNNRRAALLFSGLVALCTASVSVGSGIPDYQDLTLLAKHAVVVDQASGGELYAKNADQPRPIASITKLMMAMVVLDANLSLTEKVTVTTADINTVRKSRSRLKTGVKHTRRELLHLALMSSENRAASALARTYPGGTSAFVKAMNKKAKEFGMMQTQFKDATGLHSGNISSARDLVKLVRASYQYELIREFTTDTGYNLKQGKVVKYKNTNPLFKNESWDIGLSKTGYIKPSGYCLVMQAQLAERPVIIVLLNASRKDMVTEDSENIKGWVAALAQQNNRFIAGAGAEQGPGEPAVSVDYSLEDQAIGDRVHTTLEPSSPPALYAFP